MGSLLASAPVEDLPCKSQKRCKDSQGNACRWSPWESLMWVQCSRESLGKWSNPLSLDLNCLLFPVSRPRIPCSVQWASNHSAAAWVDHGESECNWTDINSFMMHPSPIFSLLEPRICTFCTLPKTVCKLLGWFVAKQKGADPLQLGFCTRFPALWLKYQVGDLNNSPESMHSGCSNSA